MSDDPQEYRGKSIAVRFDGRKCIHSRNCVLGRPDVFVPNASGDWIQPDAAPAEEIAAIARACPSGAITYDRLDGAPAEAAPLVNVVRLRENGPLAFHAEMEIEGGGAMLRATLCRCGASKNKPFCDGTHAAKNFRATGEPGLQDTPEQTARAGKLTIKPIRNGPIVAVGNLEVCTGTGHTVTRTQRAVLCRCGGSRNKPFCDGTHAEIGFSSE
jgi:CDGSH-type Zn-finger protein/uncharacterized Fe-S cluster protein YjdI